MSKGDFVLCDSYYVKQEGSKEKPNRLFGIFSFNEYGSQGKDHVTFHVLTKDGIACVPGKHAELISLKWYQKDVYRSAFCGGVIGSLLTYGVPHAIKWLVG